MPLSVVMDAKRSPFCETGAAQALGQGREAVALACSSDRR